MRLKYLNLKYALVNIGYMLLISGSLGFAYNYLSQSGFDDGTAGTTMSLVSLFGALLGPVAADVVDRSSKVTQKMFITASMFVCAAFSAILLLIPSGSFLILPVVVISFMCSTIGMPLLNGMAFIYKRFGGVIDYGLCRGLGSAAFALGSFFIGKIWAGIGRNTLPIWVMVAALLTLLAVQLMPNPPRGDADDELSQKGESISILQFFGRYKNVAVVALSLVLMFFCNFIILNYMAKVIGAFETSDVEGVQGMAFLIQAMVEVPAMLGFSRLMRRFEIRTILVAASVLYSIKHIVVLMCNSVPVLYAAMVLQMVSYAPLIPATVYFSDESVAEADQNKGQAVFATASTVGSLLASFVGGWLFLFFDVRLVLTVGVVSSVLGTILMAVGVRLDSNP
jgi:PPP family 3-phenylpropionic acid transporter